MESLMLVTSLALVETGIDLVFLALLYHTRKPCCFMYKHTQEYNLANTHGSAMTYYVTYRMSYVAYSVNGISV